MPTARTHHLDARNAGALYHYQKRLEALAAGKPFPDWRNNDQRRRGVLLDWRLAARRLELTQARTRDWLDVPAFLKRQALAEVES